MLISQNKMEVSQEKKISNYGKSYLFELVPGGNLCQLNRLTIKLIQTRCVLATNEVNYYSSS